MWPTMENSKLFLEVAPCNFAFIALLQNLIRNFLSLFQYYMTYMCKDFSGKCSYLCMLKIFRGLTAFLNIPFQKGSVLRTRVHRTLCKQSYGRQILYNYVLNSIGIWRLSPGRINTRRVGNIKRDLSMMCYENMKCMERMVVSSCRLRY
jgi:hypothetical protein